MMRQVRRNGTVRLSYSLCAGAIVYAICDHFTREIHSDGRSQKKINEMLEFRTLKNGTSNSHIKRVLDFEDL